MNIYRLYYDGPCEVETLGYVKTEEEAIEFRNNHQKYKENGEPYANLYYYEEVKPYDPK